jgi:hypothetical protein
VLQQRYSISLASIIIAKVQLSLKISAASATATIITPKSENLKNIISDSELPVSTTVSTVVLPSTLTPSASLQLEGGLQPKSADNKLQLKLYISEGSENPLKDSPTTDTGPSDLLDILFTTLYNKPSKSHGLQHKLYSNAQGVIYTENDVGVDFFADTCLLILLISQQVLSKHFPTLALQTKEGGEPVRLAGIGGEGPQTCIYVYLPVRLVTLDRELLTFETEVYVVDKLPCRVLLGLSFLKTYNMDMLWLSNSLPDRLCSNGKLIRIYTARPNVARPSRAMIYATRDVVVLPGEGINLPVRYRMLPPNANRYLIEPLTQFDLSIGRVGSLIRGPPGYKRNHKTSISKFPFLPLHDIYTTETPHYFCLRPSH